MTFERTFDYDLLRDLVKSDRRRYEAMTDDWSPAFESYEGPPRSREVTYLLVRGERGEFSADPPMGFFMFVPRTRTCWEMHTVMPLFGARAIAAMTSAFGWVFENTDCIRIVTAVPSYNRVALRFAKQAGLKIFGVNEKSFQKGGALHDEIWMGIGET